MKIDGHTRRHLTIEDVRARYPLASREPSLPTFTWAMVDGHDLDALEHVLARVRDVAPLHVDREPFDRALAKAASVGTPDAYTSALEEALAELEPPAAPAPVVLDTSDAITRIAVDVAAFDHTLAAELLSDEHTRAVLAWIGPRLAPARRPALAASARLGAEVLRFAAIEQIVSTELAAEEERERLALEAPAREAAARLAARAADLRRTLALEVSQ